MVNIIYFINLYGWAFDFEVQHYQKYSFHNIIRELEDNINKIDYKDIDVVVIPSCWHWSKIMNKELINKLKEQNVKIVSQYNSHLELNYSCYEADLVVASSPYLYNEIKNKYNYNNLIFLYHFVDSYFFKPKNQYNNFAMGWVGNFNNRFKRSWLIEKIDTSVKFKKNYKGFLNKGRTQADMLDYYNGIDILLITSESEGTPMSLLEACSCGKAVLSVDVGIASLVLNPYFVIPNTSEKEIIRNFQIKLNYLKENPDIVIKEGKRNRNFIKKYFDWSAHVPILDEIYNSLLNKELTKIKKLSKRLNISKTSFSKINSKDIVNLYDRPYVLGGLSKYTGQQIGIEGWEDFKKGKIYPKKIKSANRVDFQNKIVLDVGFGRGEILKYCYKNGAKLCVGIDYSPLTFEVASNYLRDTDISLYNIAVTDIDKIKENNFEVVYMIDILEHVSDKEWFEFFGKLKDKLNKKCVLIAETPATKSGGYLNLHNNYHSEKSLHNILDKYFNIVQIEQEERWFIVKCKDLK